MGPGFVSSKNAKGKMVKNADSDAASNQSMPERGGQQRDWDYGLVKMKSHPPGGLAAII